MNKLITKAENAAVNCYVRSMNAAQQTVTDLMRTKWGRYAVAVPMALSGMSIKAYAAGEDASGSAQEILNQIMGVLGPGVVALGTLVAVVGGVQLGKGFTRDDADSKSSGMMTMIGGIIIGAVGGIVSGIELNLGGE